MCRCSASDITLRTAYISKYIINASPCRGPGTWLHAQILLKCTSKKRATAPGESNAVRFKLAMLWMSLVVSHAAGICDEDLGICHCNGTLGRMPAPLGFPPGERLCHEP